MWNIHIYAYYIIYVKNNMMKFNILFAYIEINGIQYTLLVYILWAFTFENFWVIKYFGPFESFCCHCAIAPV